MRSAGLERHRAHCDQLSLNQFLSLFRKLCLDTGEDTKGARKDYKRTLMEPAGLAGVDMYISAARRLASEEKLPGNLRKAGKYLIRGLKTGAQPAE